MTHTDAGWHSPVGQPRLAAVEDDADVSALWNAVLERIAFWGRAMSVGAQWTWNVLDKTARIFAVAAILAVSVGGVLLHQPAAVIGGVLGALAILSFAEGTYRVAHDTEQQRAAAKPDDTADWLSIRLAQGNLLLEHWPPHASREVEVEAIEKAAKWERETRVRLMGLPAYFGRFGVDVGLGPEFARQEHESEERARLRRRIHRLAEIVEGYSREQSK